MTAEEERLDGDYSEEVTERAILGVLRRACQAEGTGGRGRRQ